MRYVRTFILLIYTLITVNSLGKELISINAFQVENEIIVTIENKSEDSVIIGNPEKCGATITVKADTFEGGLEGLPRPSAPPWKHIVVLGPKNKIGSMSHVWSWSFKVPLHRKAKISKMNIRLWISSEHDYKNCFFTSLKINDYSVTVKPSD